MTRLFAAIAASAFAVSTLAYASSISWYVIPEDQGDCGDECYTAPTAWIDDEANRHSFGISCEDTMVIDGRAFYGVESEIEYLDMSVDGRSLGRFNVATGLNDIYVQNANGDPKAPKAVLAALRAGQNLKLVLKNGQNIDFTLAGSRNALALKDRLCTR